MEVRQLWERLNKLRSDAALFNIVNLAQRGKAMEFVRYVENFIEVHGRWRDLGELESAAQELKNRLIQVDQPFLSRLREKLGSGDHSPAEMRMLFDPFSSYHGQAGQEHLQFDGLDLLIDALLRIDAAKAGTQSELEPGMLHYEPTPSSAILELVDHAALNRRDVLYDIGSGLGRVPFLFHLVTGLPACGVEVDPRLHERAVEAIHSFKLTGLKYVLGDARTADYGPGTIFYLFTPFTGKILHQVLRQLKRRARSGPIKICSYGSCTLQVSKQTWLRSLDTHFNHAFKLAIFESVL